MVTFIPNPHREMTGNSLPYASKRQMSQPFRLPLSPALCMFGLIPSAADVQEGLESSRENGLGTLASRNSSTILETDSLTQSLRFSFRLPPRLRNASALHRAAMSGLLWTGVGFAISQPIRLLSNLVLTRLLYPEAFGLMALVQTVVTGLALFSDIGLSTSVVRHERGDEPEFLDSVWTIQIARAVLIWAATLLISYPLAYFYAEPQLQVLLPVVGLTVVITGFNSTSILTLTRHLVVRKTMLFELSGQVVSVLVTVLLAFLFKSVWALVGGAIFASVFSLALTHVMHEGPRRRLTWNQEHARELLAFGGWIFVSTAATFLASQSDRLLIAKMFPLQFFGVYIVAVNLAEMPRALLGSMSDKVVFPSISKRSQLNSTDLRSAIERNRFPLLVGSAVLLSLVAGFGDCAVRLLYDRRYSEAQWMVMALALGVWPIALCQTIDSVLFVRGKPQYIALAFVGSFLFTLLCLPAGGYFFGSAGAVGAVALRNIPFYILINYGLSREKVTCLRQDARATLLFGILLAVILLVRSSFGLEPPWQLLVAAAN